MVAHDVATRLLTDRKAECEQWSLALVVDHEGVTHMYATPRGGPPSGAALVFLGMVATAMGLPEYAMVTLSESAISVAPGGTLHTGWRASAPVPGGQR